MKNNDHNSWKTKSNIAQQYAPGYETEMVFEAVQEEAVQV